MSKWLRNTLIIVGSLVIVLIGVGGYIFYSTSPKIIINSLTSEIFAKSHEMVKEIEDIKSLKIDGNGDFKTNLEDAEYLSGYKGNFSAAFDIKNEIFKLDYDLNKDDILKQGMYYYENNALYGNVNGDQNTLYLLVKDFFDSEIKTDINYDDIDELLDILEEEITNEIIKLNPTSKKKYIKINNSKMYANVLSFRINNDSITKLLNNLKNKLENNMEFNSLTTKNQIDYRSIINSYISSMKYVTEQNIIINIYTSLFEGELLQVSIKDVYEDYEPSFYGYWYKSSTPNDYDDYDDYDDYNDYDDYDDYDDYFDDPDEDEQLTTHTKIFKLTNVDNIHISYKHSAIVDGENEDVEYFNLHQNKDTYSVEYVDKENMYGGQYKYYGTIEHKDDTYKIEINDSDDYKIMLDIKEKEKNDYSLNIMVSKKSSYLEVNLNTKVTINEKVKKIDISNAIPYEDPIYDNIIYNDYLPIDSSKEKSYELHNDPTVDDITKINNTGESFILVFGSGNCSHCIAYHDTLTELGKSFANIYFIDMTKYSEEELQKIFNLDYEITDASYSQTSIKEGINAYPLTLIIKNGKTLKSYYGNTPYDEVTDHIANYEIK